MKAMNYLLIGLFAVQAHAAGELAQSFNFDGYLQDASGNALTTPADVKVQILDGDGTCVLFEETHASIAPGTNGEFSIRVGTGTSQANHLSTWKALFSNSGSTGSFTGCPGGVNLAAGKGRALRVFVNNNQLTPDFAMTSAPMSTGAETLQGRAPADFLQPKDDTPTDLTQANLENVFSTSNYSILQQLLNGTSSYFTPPAPSAPVSYNNQRITNLADPSAAQDASTKAYADARIAGRETGITGIGPGIGDGKVLTWDATQDKWVALTPGAPAIADDSITAAKLNSTGIAINRLVITDGTTPNTLTYAECGSNEILKWNPAIGWECATVDALSPVISVAGKTGAVALNAADVTGLGTASLRDVGTAAGDLVELVAASKLPSLDGQDLYNLNAQKIQGNPVSSAAPSVSQVLKWNGSAWYPSADDTGGGGGTVTAVLAGMGLIGGPITATGTLSVDVGVTANKIVQLDASAKLPAVDGSQLLDVNAAKLATRTIAATAPSNGQGLTWNNVTLQWEPQTNGGGADSLGDHTATQNIQLGSNWLSGDGGNEGLRIDGSGNVGIGTASPAEKVVVQDGNLRVSGGQIFSDPKMIPAGGTVDFNQGNLQVLQSVGGSSITLSSMKDGGSYVLIIEDATPRTYMFTGGCSGTFWSPANGPTIASTRTIYNILKVGANCYISWTPGYQ